MRRLLLALPLLLAVPLAGCTESSGPTAPNIATANFASSLGVDIANSIRTATGLYYRDSIVGAGAQVPQTGGTTVNLDYAGYFRSGLLFDSGADSFTTGDGTRIAGYDEGVRGMRVGGVRQLIIPPNLGYGSSAYGSIPGNSILVFNITLNGVN